MNMDDPEQNNDKDPHHDDDDYYVTSTASNPDCRLPQEPSHFHNNSILRVDPHQHYKATELKLCSFARPHMRAFHYAWISFCLAFFLWFSIAPLMPEIRESLDLNDTEVWVTHIVSVASNIFVRFVMGAVCDTFGARVCMGVILMAAAIPVALTGTIQNLIGLAVLRFFIGIAGSAFVISQCWSTRMFAKEIVGTANALVAGWYVAYT